MTDMCSLPQGILNCGTRSRKAQNKVSLTSSSDSFDLALQQNTGTSQGKLQPVFSDPFPDPHSKQLFVIISQYSASRSMIVAGAFSPKTLANQILSDSYPANERMTIDLLDPSRRLLFASESEFPESLPADHPGVTEPIRGESGTRYVQADDSEHVIAYSPVAPTGWVLITEEAWQAVVSPSLQTTQIAPWYLYLLSFSH